MGGMWLRMEVQLYSFFNWRLALVTYFCRLSDDCLSISSGTKKRH